MNVTFREKVRHERLIKKITLKELAKECGLSYSYISQVERGEASPSLSALDRIAKALGITVWQLLREDREDEAAVAGTGAGAEPPSARPANGGSNNLPSSAREKSLRRAKIIRKDMRRSILLPQSNIRYQMITPDLNSQMQILLVEAEAGTSSGDVPFEHDGEECVFVLGGKMENQVGDEIHVLEEGDSLYFSSELPHRWKNIGEGKLTMLVTVTPPAY